MQHDNAGVPHTLILSSGLRIENDPTLPEVRAKWEAAQGVGAAT